MACAADPPTNRTRDDVIMVTCECGTYFHVIEGAGPQFDAHHASTGKRGRPRVCRVIATPHKDRVILRRLVRGERIGDELRRERQRWFARGGRPWLDPDR